MKFFSLFSAAALTTIVAASGFCDEQQVDYQTAPESQPSIIAHDPNRPDDHPSAIDQSQDRRMHRIERMHGESGPPPPPPDIVINSPHGCMEHGFAVEAEFLWWRAHEDNLEYATQSNVSILAGENQDLSIHVKDPNFEYDPGVRVSAGYDFGRRNWDIFLRWTYHYTSPTASVGNSDPGRTVQPLRIQAAPQGNFGGATLSDFARVKWQAQLNVIDFEMGYDYFFSRRFSVRPHMGLKAAWIDQHYHAVYSGSVLGTANIEVDRVDVRTKSDFWGVGPRVGIDGHLHIGWGFSLYGVTSAAMLYGQFDSHYRINNTLVEIRIHQDDYSRLRTTAQMALGVRWGWCFSRKYFLSLHLGWETQYWWNQLHMDFFERFEPDGDLTYSGLDAGIRFDF